MSSISDITTLPIGQLIECLPQGVSTSYWAFTICRPSQLHLRSCLPSTQVQDLYHLKYESAYKFMVEATKVRIKAVK